MAQIATIALGKNWVKLEDKIAEKVTGFSFDADKDYQIETRGNSPSYFIEVDSIPHKDSTDGVQLDSQSSKVVFYKKASKTLYARALIDSICNITVLGE